MILGILSAVAGLIKNWWSGYQEIQAAKQKTALAVEENRAKLALNEQQYNSEWELASLKASGRTLRIMSFSLFSMPFVLAFFSPAYVHNYFTAINESIPQFWIKIYAAMTGSVWGIAALKNHLPGFIQAFRKPVDIPKPQ